MAKPAARHVAAVKALGPLSSKRVLEIGGGHGAATRLLCEAATSGQVVALDRSARMIAAIKKSCAEYVQSGRLTLVEGDFKDEVFDKPFDCIVAINVDFPRHKDNRWATALVRALKPAGQAVLVLEAPVVSTAHVFATRVTKALSPLGFEVEATVSEMMAVVDARLTRP